MYVMVFIHLVHTQCSVNYLVPNQLITIVEGSYMECPLR